MRIAHVTISHLPLDVRIYQKEARSLAEAGHEVHVLAPGPAPPDSDGVRFHSLPEGVDPTTAYFWRVWRWLPEIYRRARDVRADAYHLPDPALIPMALMLKLRGAAIVYDAHEDRPLQAFTKYLARGEPVVAAISSMLWRILEAIGKLSFDRFVAASPATAAKYPRGRTITVCNFPVQTEFGPELERPPYRDRPNQVVYVGGIHRFRGLHFAVEAMSMVPAELDARLVVVGGFSRAHDGIREEFEALPGWDRVDLLGHRPREEAVAIMARSRIGLMTLGPRYRVTLTNKMFEYMAAGIPQVVSDFPLWRSIVQDGGLGVTAAAEDAEAVADALRYLLEHPKEAEAMGNRAREAVAAAYNWESQAEKLLALYRELDRGILPEPAAAACEPPLRR